MELFLPIINQMLFLFGFIAIGFMLAKFNYIPDNSACVLSKLENMLFVPALAMGTFIDNFNISVLNEMWKLLVVSFALLLIFILLAVFFSKLCFKEIRLQKMATYGFAFSNFGFMGNAIMNAIFPEIFFEYTVFTLPIWIGIYLWGIPVLLIAGNSNSNEKITLKERLKLFANPMIIGMLIGIIIGLSGFNLPISFKQIISVSADCMSPVAMLLTGITIGRIDLRVVLKKWSTYLTTIIKLVAYPLIFFAIALLLPRNIFFNNTFFKCAMCFASMPMGLNTIVIPAAYGKDTTDAAGLALMSHLFSIITIPFSFILLENFIW